MKFRISYIIILIIVFSLSSVCFSEQSENKNQKETYKEYCNNRFGFCVKYPGNFKMKNPPANGDGQGFFDGKGFSMTVSGINNVMEDNLQTEMDSQSKGFDKITLKTKKNDWFVLSGFKKTDIVYLKTYVGKSSINHLYLQYPTNRKNEYNDMVSAMSKSFKPGDLNNSH